MTFDIALTKESKERLLAIAFADNGPSPLWQKILVQSRTHDNDDPVGKIIDTSLDYDFIKMEPRMYQKFYLTTPAAAAELAEKLKNSPEQVAACKKRLAELESLLSQDDNRCHASRDQRNFLRRMLEPYKNG